MHLGGDFSLKLTKGALFHTGGIMRQNRIGISNLYWLFIQETKSSVATVGLLKGFQAS